jgi:hypothetical protein
MIAALGLDDALARRKPKVSKSLSTLAATPLGLQGVAGAGARLTLPFVLTHKNRRRVTVQVEYGIDLDGDGEIADGSDPDKESEFRRATQEVRDPRDTARVRRVGNRTSVTYRPSVNGASHAFVWDHEADVGNARILHGAQILRDDQGRPVPDPSHSGSPQFSEALPGVVLRVRAKRRGGKKQVSAWSYTDGFSLDNSAVPTLSIDDVPVVDTDAGLIEIDWTAFDDDSEDKNGNGVLDVLDLEDRNGNGRLDAAPVAVHFDYHRLAEGERRPTSPLVLAELDWSACTHAAGHGDPDDGVPSAPTDVGRAATFVWGYESDLGGAGFADGEYLLRGTPYDEHGILGEPVYYDGSVTIDTDE